MKKFKEISARVKTAWQFLTCDDTNSLNHARTELKAMGYFDGHPMNAAMANDLLDLVRLFNTQGHSGFSASWCRQQLGLLLDFKPLGPLTGNDDEWMDVSEYSGQTMYQNKRCGRVFKDSDHAYDIDRVVFEEPNGCRFTSIHSRVPVTFPYTPKTVIAKVPKDATEEERSLAAQQALSGEKDV